jgi:predicted dehydrogenase/threonine dehydrogenase-like Zn-dependent dehydrogenase
MKQVLQELTSGRTVLADLPAPGVPRGTLRIVTRRSLISAGTERMLVEFGKAGWIDKARQQPDKVRMVLDKIRTDGLLPTIEAVRNKLDQPMPMGYCNLGEVVAIGEGVTGFSPGDRVVSNGRHAEVVAVPVNLCARVPDAVNDDHAAFTVLGAIGLQGIRLVGPTLGESVVVTGLGLIGLITVQLLRANGCRVLGLDYDDRRLELARSFGAQVFDLKSGSDPVAASLAFSRGRGVDAVVITAATDSNEPMRQAALMCRKRGRIVLVGVTGLELSRADFYEKELSFQVSCSYGPGRYDPQYEEKGFDYPVGFVRWTEQRNFEAVLDMMASGALELAPLISHRFALDDAERAYELVAGSEPSLGILLDYPRADPVTSAPMLARTVSLPGAAQVAAKSSVNIAFIGAGNYAGAALIPAFRASGAALRTIAATGGVNAAHLGKKFGFSQASTDVAAVMADRITNVAVIATRHDSHAQLVLQAHDAGKHVFVEKPLCLTLAELDSIETAWRQGSPLLMVGFNRRFAPQVQLMHALVKDAGVPNAFVMTVNAGAIPQAHWAQDPATGGGRLLGEACHFVDLLRFLARSPIESHQVSAMNGKTRDTATVTLRFADGSLGTIHYFANGSKAFPKERLEVFSAGRVLQLDNFRKMRGFGWPGFKGMNLWRQDKGQAACAQAFVDAVRNGSAAPIPLEEILEVSRVSIEIQRDAG